ncbi:hypothetical protein [Actinomadura sp. WMMA1423]|nr:hypothetical protein [Actinomadura sp. WMMA1423]
MLNELVELWRDAPWYARVVFFGVVPVSVLAIIWVIAWAVAGG